MIPALVSRTCSHVAAVALAAILSTFPGIADAHATCEDRGALSFREALPNDAAALLRFGAGTLGDALRLDRDDLGVVLELPGQQIGLVLTPRADSTPAVRAALAPEKRKAVPLQATIEEVRRGVFRARVQGQLADGARVEVRLELAIEGKDVTLRGEATRWLFEGCYKYEVRPRILSYAQCWVFTS